MTFQQQQKEAHICTFLSYTETCPCVQKLWLTNRLWHPYKLFLHISEESNVDSSTVNPSKDTLPCHSPNSNMPKISNVLEDTISETDPVHGSSSKFSFSSFFNKSSICSLEKIDYLLLHPLCSPQKNRKQ